MWEISSQRNIGGTIMKNKWLISAIIVLVLCNLGLLSMYMSEKSDKVYPLLGTYSNQTEINDNLIYFVFDRDNNYYFYEVNTLVDQGNWRKAEDNVYLIQGDHTDTMVVTDEDHFYYYLPDYRKEVIEFKRVSFTPTLFGSEDQE